ncbi:methionyl-tRNA formyltransferase [Pararhizobium mangrovi]|uniref:Methionyl-tRNA formyltransferase n=1 Tax=Pararhizobium mangrovi TaxID=2590452 RepID=A0A506U4B4_9HYPH|nr:methionyl-tRNA formyltransferase [Pararhizobium mangrovi]TPW28660.1 methionyl-tRNA formyltransferase [Pararhizobium mangrovi]
MSLRIVFMGTPEFAVPTLAALAADGHDIAAVYTRAPKPAGRRGLATVKGPVHRQSELFGYEIRTPTSLKGEEEQQAFHDLKADVAVVVAYGLILPKPILEATRDGCFNAHASMLPRWRGAAPIQRAIMAGDPYTGVMAMKMDEGLDTGPIALARRVQIRENMTSGELHDIMMMEAGRAMREAMRRLDRGELELTPQAEEGVTYARKIDKAESRIDFSAPAREVHDHIRGLSPFPGAWTEIGRDGHENERVKVLASRIAEDAETDGQAPGTVLDDALTVACGEGAVRLVRLQKAGGKAMRAPEFLRGTSLAKGSRIG